MAKTVFVEPRTLKGFQDHLPIGMIARGAAIQEIEKVFQRFGFSPVETPALEYLDVLLGAGGENTNKELFRLESPEGESIALRFDLTVPFARLLAQYPGEIKPPFRRYAIGPVWRADKPGPGRFRQFTQFDVDAAGANAIAADAEIIAVMCAVMEALRAPEFQVLINNRKLIDAVLTGSGISEIERQKHVLRVIDKLAKVGLDNVRRELGQGRVDESGDPIPGVNLPEDAINAVLAFVGIQGETRRETIDACEAALPSSPETTDALTEMVELADCLDALGVAESNALFDPSLARGLDYYNGPVFEMILPGLPQFGSVMGGGRYDGLVSRFMDRSIPSTGMSVGLDRLLAALAFAGAAPSATTTVQALVVTMGKVPQAETLRLATELRAAGIRTETFFASRKKMSLGNQLSHADHYGIPIAVILGEDELAQGVVSIKDLQEGKRRREGIDDRDTYRQAGKEGQMTAPRTEAADVITRLLMDAAEI